jgi:hypothetical protein
LTDIFNLVGDFETRPGSGSRSIDPEVRSRIAERMALSMKTMEDLELDVDSPVDVDMSNLDEANVVIIKTDQKVRARLTSSDGAAQAIPVDGVLVLISRTVGVTAIDLTRLTGLTTATRIFLGERAP